MMSSNNATPAVQSARFASHNPHSSGRSRSPPITTGTPVCVLTHLLRTCPCKPASGFAPEQRYLPMTVAPQRGRITLGTPASLLTVCVSSSSNTLPCDAHRIYMHMPSEVRNFMSLILPKGLVKTSEVLSCVEMERTSTSPD